MPAPSTVHQHPEEWPASTYGQLRGVSLKIVPANKVLFARTVQANILFQYLNNNIVLSNTFFTDIFLIIRLYRVRLFYTKNKIIRLYSVKHLYTENI